MRKLNFDFKTITKEYHQRFPVLEYVDWNNTMLYKWEYEMLSDIGAINKQGIICDYPILTISDKNNKEQYLDMMGDLTSIRNKAEDMRSQGLGSSVKISFCPRNYSLWINYQLELQDKIIASKYAEEINTPPTSSYTQPQEITELFNK